MKTLMLTIAMLFLSNTTNANMLVFYDTNGDELLQPQIVDSEVNDTIPFLIFDISNLSEPEEGVDELPSELKTIM
jgi:hypothetical protein